MINQKFKFIVPILFFAVWFLFSPDKALAGSATLTWNANSESDLAGYKIYYGTSPRTGNDPKICIMCGYTNVISNVSKNITTYAFSNLTDGATYYFSVSAYDSSNNESSFSGEVSKIIPSASSGSSGSSGSSSSSSDINPPTKPSSFKASTTTNSIVLSWANPTSDFSKVILIKSSSAISSDLTVASARSAGLIIYESNGISYTDSSVSTGKNYYYGILSADSASNYSAWSFIQANIPSLGINVDQAITSTSINSVSQYATLKHLANVSSSIVEGASQEEATTIFSYNKSVSLDESGKKLYSGISQTGQNLDTQAKYALAYFIHFGTPTTQRLGAGERAGAVKSYQAAYVKLPKSVEEWKDVVKIANGRLPYEKSITAENKAKETFKKVYLRAMVSTNTYDSNAINIMAYGLRPVNRDLKSEAFAIKTFKAIFKTAPSTAAQWDIVRAISNSGAKR